MAGKRTSKTENQQRCAEWRRWQSKLAQVKARHSLDVKEDQLRTGTRQKFNVDEYVCSASDEDNPYSQQF
jgi:hypothetical protein